MSSRSPYPRDRFPGTRRLEPDRLSRSENQPQYLKSKHEENDSEVSMKKLSEFNESLRRQQQSTSTKFQWNHILSDNRKKEEAALTAAVTKPEPTIPNFRTAPSTYSMSSTGIVGSTQENHRFIGSTALHLKEVKPGFIDNGGERFRYPEIPNEVMMGQAVGFGEKMGSSALSKMAMERIRRTEEETSSSAIIQMAMDRIRKTEEVTALAHWKMERARARSSPIDSIVDKIDGVGESAALEMEQRTSFPQTQYMREQMREALHGVIMHQQREDCSRPALTQSYVGFNGGGKRVVGPNGALFHGEMRRLPPLYPDANENRNAGQSQNGEVFIGERQQFDERHAHLSKESRNEGFGYMSCHQSPKRVPFQAGKQFSEDYGHSLPQPCIGFGRESHVIEQKNDVFGSRMNLPQGQEVPLLKSGERQELSGNYGHSLPQTGIGFGRESQVMEQRNDVFGSRINRPQGEKVPLSEGEKLELSADYDRSLHQHYLDLNVKPDGTQQENQPHPRRNEISSRGEKRKMQEDFSHSLPHHYFGLNVGSQAMEQETEVGSGTCYPQDQNEAHFDGEGQPLQHQRDCALEIYPLPKDVCTNEDSTQHISATEEVGINSQSAMEHPKRRIINLRKIREGWITLTQTSNASVDEIPDIEYGGQRWSESHVREQTDDVFSSRTNRPQGEKVLLSEGERLELSADYGRSLVQQHHLDLNVEPDETQQENQLLGSRMNHHPRQNETPSHGEKRKILENFSQSLPHHHSGFNGGSQVMEQETEALGSKVRYRQDKNEAHFHGESQHLQRQQDCALEIYPLPKDECNGVYTNEGSTQHSSAIEEVGMNSQSAMEHPKRRIIDLRKIRESRISTLTQTSGASVDEIPGSEYGGQQWNDEDSSLPRNFTDSDYQMFSRMQEFAQPTNRKSIKQRLGQPCPVNNPNPLPRKSIKQRLGPPSQVDQNRKSMKQRLGSPYGVHNPIDMPRIERHKMGKLAKENDNVFDKGVQARDVSHPVKRGRAELPEDSDEFKQLIHDTYVKFVKVLNENPAQRRKYEGEAETLKCCVCGSESKDYVTQSLVTHAFTSRKRRVEHLGLHKALCLLMGWDSMTVSKGLWAPKSLPVAEALAMKEDLVIWPPVVILHNSSIGTNLDDRIIVSIKDQEAFLRDMGFGEGISKVCRGKPANQSIIVVIFKETFSGLREAERLHNFYAKNKHGRDEFQQVNCTGGGTQRGPLHKVKHVLYGYLGIAGDLDKLDFETKSRSIIKSKKKIYALADARRHTE